MTATHSTAAGAAAAVAGYLHATMMLPPTLLRAVAGTLLAGVAFAAVVTSSGSAGGRHTKPGARRGAHPGAALGAYALAAMIGVASLAGPQILLLTIALAVVAIIVVSMVVHRSPVQSV